MNVAFHLQLLTCLCRTTGVVGASIGSAAFIYVLVAITGYLSFGNDVAGNIVGMCECDLGKRLLFFH